MSVLMMMFYWLFAAVATVLSIGLVAGAMYLFITAPTFSLAAVIGLAVWADHGILIGLLAAGAVWLVTRLLMVYEKIHVAMMLCISTFMCSMTFSIMSHMFKFAEILKPTGWKAIPIVLLAMIVTYSTMYAFDGKHRNNHNNVIVNLVAAIIHGFTFLWAVLVYCGGLVGGDMSVALQMVCLIGGAIVAFILLQCIGDRHIHIPVLDHLIQYAMDRRYAKQADQEENY